jgi:TonB family protein
MRARIQGSVRVAAIVGVDGTVESASIVQSLDGQQGLDEEAIKCVKAWTFEPGMKDGAPVRVMVFVDTGFRIQ